MGWKRRLLWIWFAASLVWVAYAVRLFIKSEVGDTAWTALGTVEAGGLLLGLPLAALGAGIAIRWLLQASDPRS